MEGVASYADMLVENDEYNCGEAHRWSSIADCHLKILMLNFTAGQPIGLMSERFEQVIQCIEHEAAHAANFNKSARPSVINLERGLASWGWLYYWGEMIDQPGFRCLHWGAAG